MQKYTNFDLKILTMMPKIRHHILSILNAVISSRDVD